MMKNKKRICDGLKKDKEKILCLFNNTKSKKKVRCPNGVLQYNMLGRKAGTPCRDDLRFKSK